MRKVIPFMALTKEVFFIFYIHLPNPKIFCKVFEEKQSCISVVESNKLSPITKHISIKHHHFRSLVHKKIIQICYIDIRKHTVIFLTKPLDEALFINLQKNDMSGDFKIDIFASERGSLIIQRATKTNKYHN